MDHPLRHFRKRRDISLAAMADALRTSIATVSRIETGDREPSADMMDRIMDETGGEVTPNDCVAFVKQVREARAAGAAA
jgi:transcriptional regulator with XRE-family HTH domain